MYEMYKMYNMPETTYSQMLGAAALAAVGLAAGVAAVARGRATSRIKVCAVTIEKREDDECVVFVISTNGKISFEDGKEYDFVISPNNFPDQTKGLELYIKIVDTINITETVYMDSVMKDKYKTWIYPCNLEFTNDVYNHTRNDRYIRLRYNDAEKQFIYVNKAEREIHHEMQMTERRIREMTQERDIGRMEQRLQNSMQRIAPVPSYPHHQSHSGAMKYITPHMGWSSMDWTSVQIGGQVEPEEPKEPLKPPLPGTWYAFDVYSKCYDHNEHGLIRLELQNVGVLFVKCEIPKGHVCLSDVKTEAG